MTRLIAAGLAAFILVAAQGAANAQRGGRNPYPEYPQSPPGGGYFTDNRGVAETEPRPAQHCPTSRMTRAAC